MRSKILFLVGLGVGYVFGTKAGRQRYNQMKDAALKVWNDPKVQEQVKVATDFVKDRAPEAYEFVTENVKNATARATATKKSAPKPSPRTTAKKPAATATKTRTTGTAKK